MGSTRGGLWILKHAYLSETDFFRPKMPLLPPWSRLADGKTSLKRAQEIGSKDQVGSHTRKEGLWRPVH